MLKKQKKAIRFFCKYPDKWHGYAKDQETTEVICSLVNLGIIQINDFRQAKLASREKAVRFLLPH